MRDALRPPPLPPTESGTVYLPSVELNERTGAIEVEVPLPKTGGWFAYGLFLPCRNKIVLCEIRLFAAEGRLVDLAAREASTSKLRIGEWSRSPLALEDAHQGGITNRLLREIRLGDLVKEMSQYLNLVASMEKALGEKLMTKEWEAALRRPPSRPGRAGRDDAYYLAWALRYLAKADSRNPVVDLAGEYGLRPEQVRDLIHEARRRNLLTSAGQGRRGGTLTQKARVLLEGREGAGGKSQAKTKR